MVRWLVGLLFLFCCVGCSTQDVTLNVQRSVLRSGGDVGATTLFSQKKMTKDEISEVRGCAIAVKTFLESGDVGALTGSEIYDQVVCLIKPSYQVYFTAGLSVLNEATVDINAICPVNVRKRLLAFICGVLTACDSYILSDEPVEVIEPVESVDENIVAS